MKIETCFKTMDPQIYNLSCWCKICIVLIELARAYIYDSYTKTCAFNSYALIPNASIMPIDNNKYLRNIKQEIFFYQYNNVLIFLRNGSGRSSVCVYKWQSFDDTQFILKLNFKKN